MSSLVEIFGAFPVLTGSAEMAGAVGAGRGSWVRRRGDKTMVFRSRPGALKTR